MKKLLTLAAVAAMTASTGAWAACSANISMGSTDGTDGFQIENLKEPNDPQDAATMAYVDAASKATKISLLKEPTVATMTTMCAELNQQDQTGTGDAYTDWRVATTAEFRDLADLSANAPWSGNATRFLVFADSPKSLHPDLNGDGILDDPFFVVNSYEQNAGVITSVLGLTTTIRTYCVR